MRWFLSRTLASVRDRLPAQDVIEYGMIIATIAMVVLLGLATFGTQIKPWFEQLAGRITTVGT